MKSVGADGIGEARWRPTTLGVVTSWMSGGTPSKENPNFWGGSIPWISARSLKSFYLRDSEDRVTEAAIAEGARLAQPGDVLMLVRGMTLHNDVPIGIATRPMAFNQDVKGIRGKDGANSRFIAYWLLGHKASLLAAVDQASHGTGRLQTDLLHAMEMRLPPECEQRNIADVLGSLDDKIEQNRRTAQSLERLVRAIFRAWFVDFEPVEAKAAGASAFPGMPRTVFDALPARLVDSDLGPVPEGWEDTLHRVGDLEGQGLLLIGDGYRAKRAELGARGLPFIRAGNVDGAVNTAGAELLGEEAVTKVGVKRSQVWDTVFTSKGTVGRIGLVTPATGDVVYSPQVCYWRSARPDVIDPFFLHMWMRSASFTSQWMAVKGETDMADFVSLSDQRAMRFPVAAPRLQLAFAAIAGPLIRMQAQLGSESSKLASLRDYLLPRLLGGRVRVGGANG